MWNQKHTLYNVDCRSDRWGRGLRQLLVFSGITPLALHYGRMVTLHYGRMVTLHYIAAHNGRMMWWWWLLPSWECMIWGITLWMDDRAPSFRKTQAWQINTNPPSPRVIKAKGYQLFLWLIFRQQPGFVFRIRFLSCKEDWREVSLNESWLVCTCGLGWGQWRSEAGPSTPLGGQHYWRAPSHWEKGI